jgi:arylsulfatase A-like enzyme
MDPRDFRHLMALYDGEIRYTDHHLGSIVDHLREIGELDRTIVVVTADHGEEFFEHGRKGHRMTLFDEVIQIPLIVRYPPKVPGGVVVDRQVRLMDAGRTILSLAGIDPPASFGMRAEGEGLRPHDLSGWMLGRPGLPYIPAFGDLEGRSTSLRTERLKFLHHKHRTWVEIFDLKRDPAETRNVAPERRKQAEALRQRVEAFLDPGVGPKPADPHQPDKEQLEKLRELGYMN